MQPKKVRIAGIERLRRRVRKRDAGASGREVTSASDVRMLSWQLQSSGPGGYGLPAIVELLSDNGLVVTAMTLKTYFERGQGGLWPERPRQDQAHRPSGLEPRGRLRRLNRTVPRRRAPPREAHSLTRGCSPRQLPRRRHIHLLRAPLETARPSDDASARQSALVPKKDTTDISESGIQEVKKRPGDRTKVGSSDDRRQWRGAQGWGEQGRRR
jgi:hypothetical protein